jgi:hypothetical protein
MTPVVELIETPLGRPVALQMNGGTPPVVAMESETAIPYEVAGREVVVMAITGGTWANANAGNKTNAASSAEIHFFIIL